MKCEISIFGIFLGPISYVTTNLARCESCYNQMISWNQKSTAIGNQGRVENVERDNRKKNDDDDVDDDVTDR